MFCGAMVISTLWRYEVDLSGQNNFQKEVDRILDKINDRGFGSLTGEEKKSLEKAKSFLNKN